MCLSAAGQFHVIKEQGSYNSMNPPNKKNMEIVASIFITPCAWLYVSPPGSTSQNWDVLGNAV